MQKYLTTLLTQSGADAWSVTDEQKYGWQLYYIRHKLDQNRVVNTEHTTVTVYRRTEDGRYLGSASEEIAPTASREEVQKAIGDLLERAAYVRNPAYELRQPTEKAGSGVAGSRDPGKPAARVIGKNFAGDKDDATTVLHVTGDFLATMQDLPETPTEDVNSYEIFVNHITRRLITSNGIDQIQRYPSSMLEVVTNARNEAYLRLHPTGAGAAGNQDLAGQTTNAGNQKAGAQGRNAGQTAAQDQSAGQNVRHTNAGQTAAAMPEEEKAEEIELYRMYHSGTCDTAGLRRDITRTLQYGKDRLRTVPTPKIDRIPVIFSTADSVQIYQFFVDRMNAQMIYQKTSEWELEKPITDDNAVKGDRVTISARKFLPNSSQNYTFDEEGAPIRDEVLIQDNVAKNYWGNAMFSSYLGQKDTFLVSNYEVSGGSRSEAEIRRGRYLEIVEFSDFQVDAMTGAIYGEIRLGYLHESDDESPVIPVTGGSVSGSILDYMKEMYFSKETVQYDNAQVPAVTKLMDVTVTGAGR